jgi:signal-transduction protein with cAMP-binding, CBS, and nucleotidyltransferase domain
MYIILGAYQAEKLQKKLEFFKSFSLFKEVSGEALGRQMHLFEDMEIKSGSFIFKEGDPVDYLFFVLSGEIEVDFLFTYLFIKINLK